MNEKISYSISQLSQNFLRKKIILMTFLVAIFVVGIFSITFHIQEQTESNVRATLISEQKQRQILQTNNLVSQISDELTIILHNLEDIANYVTSCNCEYTDSEITQYMELKFEKILSVVDARSVNILDKNGIVVSQIGRENDDNEIIGTDLSFRDYFQITKSTKLPYFSNGFTGILSGERFIMVTQPILNEQTGEFEGLVSLLILIEDFFGTSQKLIQPESQFLSIVDNAQKIILYSNDDLIGESVFGIKIQQATGNIDIINKMLENVFSGKPSSAVYEFNDIQRITTGQPIFVDGNPVYFAFIITPTEPIYEKTHSILIGEEALMTSLLFGISSFLIISLIIFEKNHLKEKKASKLSVIGNIAAQIAHDMRNPLGSIRNSVEFLEKSNLKEIDDNARKETFALIHRSIDRISHQVDNVLDYVRNTPVHLKKHRILDVINSALDRLTIPETVTLQVQQSDIEIKCDFFKLETVFVNLVLNSLQAINGRGKIIIRIHEKIDFVLIEVEDSGIGISKKVLPKIFDPLFTTKETGTGLGLAGCKNIIEQHGGKISIKSPPTTFFVLLPKNPPFQSDSSNGSNNEK